eukprot:538215-Pelagomonas_calceolata.AAC.2
MDGMLLQWRVTSAGLQGLAEQRRAALGPAQDWLVKWWYSYDLGRPSAEIKNRKQWQMSWRRGQLDEINQGGQVVLQNILLHVCLQSEKAYSRTTQKVGEVFQGRDQAKVLWACVCWSASTAMSALATHPMQLSVTSPKQEHGQQQAFDAAPGSSPGREQGL